MKAVKGKNQSYARQLNNQLVMRELRNGVCSATMLSRKLNLSNAALSGIIDDLQKNGYIREADIPFEATSVGRRPVYYTVNENFGYIVVVSLADFATKVVVSDMKMNITEMVETKVERYDVATLYELVLAVKNVTNAPKYRDMTLLGIDLAIPGKVNLRTGRMKLSARFEGDVFDDKEHIINLFARQFDVPVVMTSDINLSALGEMHKGLLRDVQNGMVVHVNELIDGALIIGGKMYSGEQGLAGEIGYLETFFNGELLPLDEVISMRAMRRHIGAHLDHEVSDEELFELYEKDEYVKNYVLSTAKCLGHTLKNVVELLDLTTIILSGDVLKFGNEYLDILNEQVAQSSTSACVLATTLGKNAAILGAVSKAVEALTDDIFLN
jgi:predicted NBD/HSP70 family sugar kinase